jgi:hypothetical protein
MHGQKNIKNKNGREQRHVFLSIDLLEGRYRMA